MNPNSVIGGAALPKTHRGANARISKSILNKTMVKKSGQKRLWFACVKFTLNILLAVPTRREDPSQTFFCCDFSPSFYFNNTGCAVKLLATKASGVSIVQVAKLRFAQFQDSKG